MSIWIYSTLTNGVTIAEYSTVTPGAGNDIPRVIKKVSLNGGAGVASKRLITELGVSTLVTQAELDFLEANAMFQHFVKDGFIKVVKAKGNRAPEVESIVGDMEQRDKSSPLVPNDFDDTKKAPSTDLEQLSAVTTAPRWVGSPASDFR